MPLCSGVWCCLLIYQHFPPRRARSPDGLCAATLAFCSLHTTHRPVQRTELANNRVFFNVLTVLSSVGQSEYRCSPVPAFLLTPTPRCGLRITDVKPAVFHPCSTRIRRDRAFLPVPFRQAFTFTVRRLSAPIFIVAGFLLHYRTFSCLPTVLTMLALTGGLSVEFPHNSRRDTSLFGACHEPHRLVMLTGFEPILRD